MWSQVWPLAAALALALVIRGMVIESYYVPSESMLPTLLIGDHVFVNKFTYGSKIPLTNVRLPAVREPRRGEVVIFALGRDDQGRFCPLDECPDRGAEGFVKRIVGLPGDTLEFRDGVLEIEDVDVKLCFTGDRFEDDNGLAYDVGRETVDGYEHAVLEHAAMPGLKRSRVTVPENRYFVMGDNRDNSNDSRKWGTFHHDDIKGPVMFIYWSWNNRSTWPEMANPLTWWRLLTGETRWSRTGDSLDDLSAWAPCEPDAEAPAPAES